MPLVPGGGFSISFDPFDPSRPSTHHVRWSNLCGVSNIEFSAFWMHCGHNLMIISIYWLHLIAESLLCSHKAASTFEFAWPWYSNVPSESRSVAGSHFRNTSLGRSCTATFCSPSVEHCDEWTILTVHQSCRIVLRYGDGSKPMIPCLSIHIWWGWTDEHWWPSTIRN